MAERKSRTRNRQQITLSVSVALINRPLFTGRASEIHFRRGGNYGVPFLFGGVPSLSVISPMITRDIKKNSPALDFQSNAGDLGGARIVGGRERRFIRMDVRKRDPRGSLKYRADAGSFRYSWPRGPDEADSSSGSERRRRSGKGPARFITSHREGARPMRNCLCPCPALSDASDTFERTYHVHAYAARTRACARVSSRPSAPRFSPPCSTSLFLRSG